MATINHIRSECCTLAKTEYNSKLDWAGKRIYLELCKKMKSDITEKRCIHKPESFFENKIQEIIWDFELKTTNPIPDRKPDIL